MAYEFGTATDHADLYSKLISFLTTNADLVAANENWQVDWTHSLGNQEGMVLTGPGLSQADNIRIGMRLEQGEVALDRAEIQFSGCVDINSSANSFREHVNATPQYTRALLRTQTMDYWFTASGRRFMGMVRVANTYQHFYCGFILPYAYPEQYPYPLFIGACASSGGRVNADAWTSTKDYHAHFTRSFASDSYDDHFANSWLLSPSGEWLNAGSGVLQQVKFAPNMFGDSVVELERYTDYDAWGYRDLKNLISTDLDGEHLLIPYTLLQQDPADQTYGILDGLYYVSGKFNAAENTIAVGAENFVVGLDVFRTSVDNFFAMKVE